MISNRIEVEKEDLEAGDVVCVKRGMGYYHFGVYIGSNQVIHFSGDYDGNNSELSGAKIIQTSLDRFLSGGVLLKEFEYSECGKFPKKKVVERAQSYLGSALFIGLPYNFLTNNCEHFASWCATGEKKCSQVRNVLSKLNDIFNR